jgi:hypothetical protein
MPKTTRLQQIIPAAPGFYAGGFMEDIDIETGQPSDVDEWFEPIIAWVVVAEFDEEGDAEPTQSVRPVGVKGDFSSEWMIRLPDGKVKRHFDEAPISLEKAKEEFLADKRSRLSRPAT